MTTSARRLAPRVTALAVAIVAAAPGLAGATPPGANGAIAFKRYVDDAHSASAIYTIRPDGTGERQLTHPAGGQLDDQPDWSRNGKRIVFTREGVGASSIWTVRPDGSDLTRLSPACSSATAIPCEDDANVSFLPSGRRVVFTRSTGIDLTIGDSNWIEHSDLVTRKLDGTGTRVILRGRQHAGDNVEAAFAPNGRRLVYVQVNSPRTRPEDGRALVVMDADGGQRHRITPWALGAGDNPDWSPDGKLILFRSHEEGPEQSQIMVVRPDGSGVRALTHLPAGTTVLSYSFSPDGRSIVFAQEGVDGEPDLFTMRRDGSHVRQLTRTSVWDSAPDWGPRS